QRMAPLADQARSISNNKLMPRKPPQEKLPACGPHDAKNPRKFERAYAVDSKHCDRYSIVAKYHGATSARSPPQTLLTEGELPILDVHGNVGIEQLEMVYCWVDGRRRHGKIGVANCD